MLRLKVRKQALREMGKAFAVGFLAAAVLWLTSGLPVVSQTTIFLPPRQETERTLEDLIRQLFDPFVAAEIPLLDPGHAAFVSHTVGNIAWIPLDPTEWTEEKRQLLQEVLEGKPGEVTVGVLAVGDDLAIYDPSLPDQTFILPAGTYLTKVRWDEGLGEAVGALVDREGNVITGTRLLVLEESEEAGIDPPTAPFVHTRQLATSRFLVVVGSEPISQSLHRIEAKLDAAPNPIVIKIVIIARITLTARQVAVGAGLLGCLVKC